MNNNIFEILIKINSIYNKKKLLENPIKKPREERLAPGIINIGNSCFFNSMVQFFYSIEELVSFLLNKKIIDQYQESPLTYFIKIISLMNIYKNTKEIITEDMISIHNICSEIQGKDYQYSQEDSSEILMNIFKYIFLNCETKSLNIEYNKICKNNILIKDFPKNDPRNYLYIIEEQFISDLNIKLEYPIIENNKLIPEQNDLYESQNEQELEKKYKESNNYKLYIRIKQNILKLDFTEGTKDNISDIINQNMSGIHRTNKYFRDDNYKLYARKYNFIPNKYLIIYLNIFKENIYSIKSNSINLMENNGDGFTFKYLQDNKICEKSYELISTCNHTNNNINSGHYISYVKHLGIWYCYNDSNRYEDDTFFGNPYLILYREKYDYQFDYIDPENISNNLMEYLVDI